jgi:methoxymalonate biosynthesis acyl carrier protein
LDARAGKAFTLIKKTKVERIYDRLEKNEIEKCVAAFIEKSIGIESLDRESDIFTGGIANSLFALQLIQFVEQRFGLVVTDEDLEASNFRSVQAVSSFVERKLTSSK